MSTAIQLTSRFDHFKEKINPAKNAFDLLDDVGANFATHFQADQTQRVEAEKSADQRLKDQQPKESLPRWDERPIASSYAQRGRGQAETAQREAIQEKQITEKSTEGKSPEVVSANSEEALVKEKGLNALKSVLIEAKESRQIFSRLQNFSAESALQAPNLSTLSENILSQIRGTPAGSNGAKVSEVNRGVLSSMQDGKATEQTKGKALQKSQAGRYQNEINRLKQQLMDQMRFELRMAVRNGVGDVNVRLNPHFLGSVNIQLHMDASSASAHFLVENQTVKGLLQAHSSELKEGFSEKGFSLEAVEVSVSNQDGSEDGTSNAFTSIEDQKVAKEWLNSFKKFGQEELENNENNAEETVVQSDQLLNVVV